MRSPVNSSYVQDIPASLVAAFCFALYVAQAQVWSALGVFNQIDVLFDTDLLFNLQLFASGWMTPSIRHAGLSGIGVANRALAYLFAAVGLTNDPAALSNTFALLVAPLSGAAAIITVYLLGITAGCRRAASAVIAAAYGATFISRVFFSMPESYPLASIFLLCSFLMVAIEARQQRDLNLIYWVLVTVATAAITITNVAAVGVAFVASRWARRGISVSPVVIASIIGVCSLAFCMLLLVSLNAILGRELAMGVSLGGTVSWAQKFLISDVGLRLLGLASLPVYLMGIPEFGTGVNTWGIEHGAEYLFALTYEPTKVTTALWVSALAGASLWAVLFTVGLRDRNSRPLALAALLVFLVNLLLHFIFGAELFLYGQHFSAVLVAICVSAQRARPMKIALLGLLTVAIALQGQYRIDAIDRVFGL